MNNENPILYILNENNKWINKKYIDSILEKYNVGYKIKSIEQFKKAMVHTSYIEKSPEEWLANKSKKNNLIELEPIDDPKKAIPLQQRSYERLEFLGDSVLHCIIANYIFHRYTTQDEGFMTKLRTKIENGDTLSLLSQKIGLDQYILVSRYIDKMGGRENNTHILEDVFEAFIGALYIDGGFDVCNRFVVNMMEEEVDFANIIQNENNFKDTLLQYCHKMRWRDPAYGHLDVSGPENNRMFTMYVKIRKDHHDDGEIAGTGVSSSKKKGEQEAARQALIKFGVIQNETESDEEVVELDSDDE